MRSFRDTAPDREHTLAGRACLGATAVGELASARSARPASAEDLAASRAEELAAARAEELAALAFRKDSEPVARDGRRSRMPEAGARAGRRTPVAGTGRPGRRPVARGSD